MLLAPVACDRLQQGKGGQVFIYRVEPVYLHEDIRMSSVRDRTLFSSMHKAALNCLQ